MVGSIDSTSFRLFTRYIKDNPRIFSFIVLLSVIGPGVITGSVDNDPAGITTYSLAGSQYGYMLLWTLLPMTIALAVLQEMGIRMGTVTGKGLGALIREHADIRIVLVIMVAYVISNLGVVMAEFSGVAVSCGMFGVPVVLGVPIAALTVWLLVIKSTYRRVEKVFLFTSFLYISYILAALLSHPNWNTAVYNSFVPQGFSWTPTFLILVLGLVGTTIAPWQLFYIQSTSAEKHISIKNLLYGKFDAIFGAFLTNFVAWFIIVACAATIFTTGITVTDVPAISQALVPLAGKYASLLFAFGFLNASLFALCIIPLSTVFPICESLGVEAGIHFNFGEAPTFHSLYLGILIAGALIILIIPSNLLLNVLFFSQVIIGVTLPVFIYYMLRITNNPKVMGEYVNSKLFNWIASGTAVLVVGISILSVVTLFPIR